MCFFPYTCRNSTNLLIYNQKMPKILLFNAFALLCREWKMSQITHFCGVKYLAWKSGGVKFWTNIMSDQNVEHIYCRCWHFGNNQDLRPGLTIGQNSGLLHHTQADPSPPTSSSGFPSTSSERPPHPQHLACCLRHLRPPVPLSQAPHSSSPPPPSSSN